MIDQINVEKIKRFNYQRGRASAFQKIFFSTFADFINYFISQTLPPNTLLLFSLLISFATYSLTFFTHSTLLFLTLPILRILQLITHKQQKKTGYNNLLTFLFLTNQLFIIINIGIVCCIIWKIKHGWIYVVGTMIHWWVGRFMYHGCQNDIRNQKIMFSFEDLGMICQLGLIIILSLSIVQVLVDLHQVKMLVSVPQIVGLAYLALLTISTGKNCYKLHKHRTIPINFNSILPILVIIIIYIQLFFLGNHFLQNSWVVILFIVGNCLMVQNLEQMFREIIGERQEQISLAFFVSTTYVIGLCSVNFITSTKLPQWLLYPCLTLSSLSLIFLQLRQLNSILKNSQLNMFLIKPLPYQANENTL